MQLDSSLLVVSLKRDRQIHSTQKKNGPTSLSQGRFTQLKMLDIEPETGQIGFW